MCVRCLSGLLNWRLCNVDVLLLHAGPVNVLVINNVDDLSSSSSSNECYVSLGYVGPLQMKCSLHLYRPTL